MIRTAASQDSDGGFTLIEVVVAIVLLGFLAIAILPALVMGLDVAAQQSTRATAIRAVNGAIEDARAAQTCAGLQAAASPLKPEFYDGANNKLIRTGSVQSPCENGKGRTYWLDVAVENADGDTIHSTRALIFVP